MQSILQTLIESDLLMLEELNLRQWLFLTLCFIGLGALVVGISSWAFCQVIDAIERYRLSRAVVGWFRNAIRKD